jgi:DNA-binding beta-propeller fold protein YncE
MNTWINRRNPVKQLKKVMTRTLPAIALSVTTLISTNTVNAEELKVEWQVNNFDQPESVVVNSATQAIYVSNINGQPTELNGEGYISKLSIKGEVLDKHWLKNLNAPKGMAIHNDFLYIADMQQVHQVSISQARIIKQYTVDQAKMLNDITIADDGTVYISDLLAGGIYRIADEQIAAWFSHEQLPHPNGLLWQQGKLLVASWGIGMNNDFTTQTAGSIYTLNIKTSDLAVLKGSEQLGNLDGLVQHNDTLYVSDWISGDLFRIQDNKNNKILTLKPGLADIAGSGSLIFTPSMFDGQLTAWSL